MKPSNFVNLLFDHLPEAVCLVDSSNKISFCNQPFISIINADSLDSIIGKNAADHEFLNKAISLYHHANKNGNIVFKHENSEYIALCRLITPEDNDTVSSLFTFYDAAIFSDYIEEREGAHRLHEFHLKQIIAMMPGHIYWQDENLNFLGCNDEQAKDAGLESADEIIGKSNYDMPWKDEAEDLNKINMDVMLTGRPHVVEEVNVRPDGTRRVYLSQKVPLKDLKGTNGGIIGVSLEITQQKELENKLRAELGEAISAANIANKVKTDFQQNLSHSLKTPLNIIVGCFECVKLMNPSNAEVLQMCKDGIEAAKTMVAMADRMLGFSKIESCDIPIRQDEFNLREALEPLIKNYATVVHEKKIDLHYSYPTDLPDMLASDSDRLLIIIKELLENAIKFTNDGGVTLIIEIRKVEKNKATLFMEVRDTGIGIAEEHQKTIFDKYTRLEPSYKGLHEGEGLGLTIVKQFVDDLDGEITLFSKEGESTVMSVKLPITLLHEVDIVQTAWDELYPDVSMLIIDDNVGGEIVERQMASSQVHAMTVERALNHLLSADGQTFDMILIDDSPQDYDLLSLCRLLKKLPTVQDSMLLLLTQPATASTVTRWKQIGIYDYIVKPYTPTEFLDKLADCWQRFKY